MQESGALRDYYVHFKTVSDAKWAIAKGTAPTFEQLKRVNDALKAIQEFEPGLDVEEANGATVTRPPRNGNLSSGESQLPQ